jgi:hypothetical protein
MKWKLQKPVYPRHNLFRMQRHLIFLLFVTSFFNQTLFAASCSYETWDWDTIQKKSVNHRKVVKDKKELEPEERSDVDGCSVCIEDQSRVEIAGLPAFTVCKVYRDRIVQAVSRAQQTGFKFQSIIGYRVGKSKGPIDPKGLRTQFSNHSFGTAVDFNSEVNGLYDNCPSFNAKCKLLRGGVYRPDTEGAIVKDSSIYQEMLRAGFKWGGEISGKQKDFMHFSTSGY